jgi:hypothetical protein
VLSCAYAQDAYKAMGLGMGMDALVSRDAVVSYYDSISTTKHELPPLFLEMQ